MSSTGHVWVTLHRPEGVSTIPVPANARGELPALLINPRDGRGRPVAGTWLAIRGDDTELTTRYEPLAVRA
jgi:hypothetical protein